MGKRRIIAETGAGQHGVATATVCAWAGLECVVYMGTEDMRRQALNVFRMRLCGAKVVGVDSGSRTLKDAINEALRDWVTNVGDTHYLLGSVLGPHPYPAMVRDFQSVIGIEARQQMIDRIGRLPDCLVACVGGGSNAIGLFHAFLNDESVRMVGVEAGGRGLKLGEHAARFLTEGGGSVGVLQGTRSYVLQDEAWSDLPHSFDLCRSRLSKRRAGARFPARSAARRVRQRRRYRGARRPSSCCARMEGIIPALETAHAIAHVCKLAPRLRAATSTILINSVRPRRQGCQYGDGRVAWPHPDV
jgi:tryptophan synthase beta chain